MMEPILTKKNFKKSIDDLIVYWSPAVHWNKNNSEVNIGNFLYSGFVLSMFPEFYFITQNGITVNQLIDHFSNIKSKELYLFIKDLLNKRILVDSILTPKEVFLAQGRLFNNPYNENVFLDPIRYNQFKKTQLNRHFMNCLDENIPLQDFDLPESIVNRKSYRIFDEEIKIPFETFSKILTVFKQRKTQDGIRYNYASAGGLYPIDIFIYVKDNRIHNVKGGLYYYNPIENQLQLVSASCVITQDAHYQINKSIFDSSASSIFLIYDSSVTMPRYGGLGYFYACIEVGIMVNLLTQIAELNQIGLCSIGEMDFNKVEKYFKLNKNQVFMHVIEIGSRLNESIENLK